MSRPAKGVKIEQVANLDGLDPLVVQGIRFNDNYYTGEFAVQYSPSSDSTIISATSDTDNLDWINSSGVSQLNFKKFVTLDSSMAGHTQTLLERYGLLLTGLKSIIFPDLKEILSKADDNQKKDFYADDNGNTSWTLFDNYMSPSSSSSQSNSSINWATNFIALPNQISDHKLVNGQYINIVGANSLVENPLRTELAESPDGEHYLLAINDHSNTLFLTVFDMNLLSDLSDKYDDISETMAAYWNGQGFPTAKNAYNAELRREALMFYQTIFDNDDIAFDLSKQTDSINKNKTTFFYLKDILNQTNPQAKHFSFQGFGIDNHDNLYISSGFSPDSSEPTPNNHIYKIENGSWIDINCNNAFRDTITAGIPEIENVQVLKENCLLVSVAVHTKPLFADYVTSENRVYRVSWES